MLRYTIAYETRTDYLTPVAEGSYQLLVRPQELPGQTVAEETMRCVPDVPVSKGENHFGFTQFFVRVPGPFSSFDFTYHAVVKKEAVDPYQFIPLEKEPEQMLQRSGEYRIEHHLFLLSTPLTELEYIHTAKVPVPGEDEGVWDFLQTLNRFVYDHITYCSTATDVTTTAGQVFALQQGVCQDYAHL